MKYANFITRLLCLFLLLAALGKYQASASQKAEKEAENAAAVAEVEAYNREVRKQMESAEKASGDSDSESDSESPYQDGVFAGVAEGFGGPIRVAVTIEGGDLTNIEVIEASGEDPAYFSQAQAVIDDILSVQGVTVDSVSGATFSSTGLINAVTEALREAVN